MRASHTLASFILGGSLTIAAAAQSPVDRQILGVGITPSASGAAGGSFFDITVMWTVGCGPISATTNAGTVIMVFKNGGEVPILTSIVPVLLDGGSGFCGIGGCSGGCGGGYIDGVFNTMLCLDDYPGCQQGNCDCSCRFPSIKADMGPEPFVPGDEIMVLLFPAPGAVPEPNGDNNTWATTFDGVPHFWQRTIESVQTVPAASGLPGRVDVVVAGNASWHGLGAACDLGFEAQLVDGAGNVLKKKLVVGVADPAGDSLACGGVGCGGLCGFWNGTQVDCAPWPNVHFIPCVCGGGWFAIFPDQIPGQLPGATVVLAPAPGALPELPGFPTPETHPVPAICVGDLNGDGIVNGADLGLLLSAWETPGPGDLNGDQKVNGADLGLLLANWGPCNDV